MEFVDEIYQTAREVRDEILQKAFRQAQENGWHDMNASTLLQGRCIEASDTLVEQLREKGYDCEARQCWCLYENYESCTSSCYEEHWLVAVNFGEKSIFLDATIQQFQWAFEEELPEVYIGYTMPNFFLSREPDKEILNACGWMDYYDGYDGFCNFDYYGHSTIPENRELCQHISDIFSKKQAKSQEYEYH